MNIIKFIGLGDVQNVRLQLQNKLTLSSLISDIICRLEFYLVLLSF